MSCTFGYYHTQLLNKDYLIIDIFHNVFAIRHMKVAKTIDNYLKDHNMFLTQTKRFIIKNCEYHG